MHPLDATVDSNLNISGGGVLSLPTTRKRKQELLEKSPAFWSVSCNSAVPKLGAMLHRKRHHCLFLCTLDYHWRQSPTALNQPLNMPYIKFCRRPARLVWLLVWYSQHMCINSFFPRFSLRHRYQVLPSASNRAYRGPLHNHYQQRDRKPHH